ncbi:GspMb/PilO family protein [Bosea sp. NPDC055332]
MNRFSLPSAKEILRAGPWLGSGLLILVAVLGIGFKALEIASERSDFDSVTQRLIQARTLRTQLKSENDPTTMPFIQPSPQRPLATALRQRLEQSGTGSGQIAQLQLLERRQAERFDISAFSSTIQLSARELERWLFNLERLPPAMLIDRVDVRLATPQAVPTESRMLQVTVNGRAIVDDQNPRP